MLERVGGAAPITGENRPDHDRNGYPDRNGSAGKRLVPEVAAAMPQVTNGGRTYTFRIRRGFRFSPPSNEEMTAATFKHSFERLVSPRLGNGGRGPSDAPAVVGLAAFRAGTCNVRSGQRFLAGSAC